MYIILFFNTILLLENGLLNTPTTTGKEEEVKKLMQQTYLTPLEVKNQIFQIWENYGEFLNVLLGAYPSPTAKRKFSSPDMFFLEVFPVPPSRFRPVRSEHTYLIGHVVCCSFNFWKLHVCVKKFEFWRGQKNH